jgi:NAD(P)-dependent dehydrogenase (short-subunit alcohol dehydrogenase family)
MSAFAPQTAVITGGASGIGLAVGKVLAGEGVKVMLADLAGEKLDEAARSIGAIACPCDVRSEDDWTALAKAAFDQLGSIHLFFNNAGVGGVRGKMWEVDPAEARAHFDVNFWGVWNGIRAFAPLLVEQSDPSAIYNTASENSFFCAVPQTAAYIAAKHAVLGMTESLREDLPPHVHAGTVIPGWVFTGLGDARMMQHGMPVEQYADIIVPQMLGRRRFVVSHKSNLAMIDERMSELLGSYETHGFDDTGMGEGTGNGTGKGTGGDASPNYDVRTFLAKLMAR